MLSEYRLHKFNTMQKLFAVADAYQLTIPFEEYNTTNLAIQEGGLEVEDCSKPEVQLTMVKAA